MRRGDGGGDKEGGGEIRILTIFYRCRWEMIDLQITYALGSSNDALLSRAKR